MEIYDDFQGGAAAADDEGWRKSKRLAEDAAAGKGSGAPVAGAYSKRNRSALDDITNHYTFLADKQDRMVTRSALRAAQGVGYLASLMDIVESKKTCSVKTSLLTAMLCDEGPSVLDEDKRARVVSCFVGEGNWNVDSKRFEGVPDWARVKVKLLRILAEPHGNGEVVMMSSQQWAAPRENGSSSAMMISPAMSERLSDRTGLDAAIAAGSIMNKMLDVEQGIKTDTEMESEEAPAEQAIELVEDMRNASNPQYCVEYAQEIFVHLIRTESKLAPSGNYMDTVQHDINPVMRGILVDWLVEVAEEYKLSQENLFLSTNYVDRFLSVMPVLRGRLQLVGVTCMLIASKYEEIFAPQVEDFVYITDSTYSAAEVLQMEVTVLNALHFNLTAVTPYCFLKRLTSLLDFDEQRRHLSEYLAEITIQEFPFIDYKPSQIAASAVCLTLHTLHEDVLPPTLRRMLDAWNTDMDVVTKCCREMHVTHTRIYNKQRTLQASFEKFSHSKLSKVSLMPPRSPPPFS